MFLFFWSVFVYDVVAYWTWSLNGWLRTLGSLDFAGGSVVHIVSGMSGLAWVTSLRPHFQSMEAKWLSFGRYAIVVGPRVGFKQKEFNPVNLSDVFIGTALLWFGWFGFNGTCSVARVSTKGLFISISSWKWTCNKLAFCQRLHNHEPVGVDGRLVLAHNGHGSQAQPEDFHFRFLQWSDCRSCVYNARKWICVTTIEPCIRRTW